ncbi:unnamed protein product [marine sediment metagenome]|uniref:Large ribosomal subunit protein bL25 beta domain-containing protein n=1 Tax=marine sediment metagenome TaxID=412755 RepID=X1RI76_9ZZZZ
MAEKIRVEVPIVSIGEAPALKLKENFLLQELNSLSVECLPGEIPNRVDIDLASLTEVGQAIHVKDIMLDKYCLEVYYYSRSYLFSKYQ